MSFPSDRRVPSKPEAFRKYSRFVLLGLVVAVAGALSVWWWTSSWRWIRQAESIVLSDPLEADALAAAALEFGTNMAPRAWLVRCRAQLALKHSIEALGAFAQIKNSEQCPANAWCALIEESQTAEHFLLTDLAMSQALKLHDDRLRVLTLVLPTVANTIPEHELDQLLGEIRTLSDRHADGWRAIGLVQKERGRFGEAVAAFRKGCEFQDISHPTGLSCRRDLAQLLIEIGQFAEAEQLVLEVMKVSNPLTADRLRLAQIRHVAGDQLRCLEMLDEILKEAPSELAARLLRGSVLVELDRLEGAQTEFEICVQIAPFHAEAHYRLAQTLIRRGIPDVAADHVMKHRRLARLQTEFIELKRRLASAPDDLKLIDDMADLLEALGQPNRASDLRRAASAMRQANKK